MSLDARREYLQGMQRRYHACVNRQEKSRIVDAGLHTDNGNELLSHHLLR